MALDRQLDDAIAQFAGTPERKPMPKPLLPPGSMTGHTSFLGDIGKMIDGARKALDEAKTDAAGAVMEFHGEVSNVQKVAQRFRDEAAEIRAAFTEGANGAPADDEPAA